MSKNDPRTIIPDTKSEIGAAVLVVAGFCAIGAATYGTGVSIWAAVALLVVGVATYCGLKYRRIRQIGPDGIKFEDGDDGGR